MAPFDPTLWGSWAEPVIHVLIGMGFGFALERAGLGSAKKLTSQFYLNDLSVLKVMFTAIITTMVLLFWSVALGLVDFAEIWVPPTYWVTQVAGGLLFGVGFVVGGYCPGTAVVAASTLKIDGMFFVGGVMVGILGFGYTVPLFDVAWTYAGGLGRVTLYELFSIPEPYVVFGVVLMALGMFFGAEHLEAWMKASGSTRKTEAGGNTPGASTPSPPSAPSAPSTSSTPAALEPVQ